MRSFAPLLSLAFLCAACDPPTARRDVVVGHAADAAALREPSVPPIAKATTDATPPAPPVAPPAAGSSARLAKSNNALAFDLYGRARAQAGNLALSPISISTALTMTWGGARGETAAQMKKVLHAEGEADKAMDVSGKLVASFGGADSKVTLARRQPPLRREDLRLRAGLPRPDQGGLRRAAGRARFQARAPSRAASTSTTGSRSRRRIGSRISSPRAALDAGHAPGAHQRDLLPRRLDESVRQRGRRGRGVPRDRDRRRRTCRR